METFEKSFNQNDERGLTKHERRQLKKQRKQQESEKTRKKQGARKTITILVLILLLGGALSGLVWFIASAPNLPPITMEGHIEQSPPSHILNERLPESIQKHMLEHADGKEKAGIIMQYNCKQFECEPNLIEKLTELAKEYPENVYLAPNNYDGKIILTKLGKREILDDFDEERIRKFIGE